MKKILLVIPLCMMFLSINAQNCVPEPNLPPDFLGVWPIAEMAEPCDTLVPDQSAYVNCPYEFTFTAFAPATIDFNGIPVSINNITVNDVQGLPTGLSYICEPPSCVFNGGASGCLKVVGTPDATNTVGSYPLTINTTANTAILALDITFPPDPADNAFGLPLCPYVIDLQPECAPATVDVTFQVDMTETPPTGPVYLTGSAGIDNWCGTCLEMTDPDSDNVFTYTIALDPNSTHEYKFNNGGWAGTENLDVTEDAACTNGNATYTNRVVTIGADPMTLDAVCFNSCEACPPAATDGDVTFRVDMTEYAGAAYTTVHINGTFNSWCGDCNPLTDMGNGIWETTLTLPLGNIDYKFTVDGWAGEETFTEGDPCTTTEGGFTNRDLDVTGDEVLSDVCWNSCEACGPAATDGDVTFRVDMSEYAGDAYTTVHINGTFNNWCGDCNPLTDMGNGIWETTLTLALGNIDYKFTVDGWTGEESFTEGDPCTATAGGFTNRDLDVTGDEVLPAVCWNSCNLCGATDANITFRVDMTEYAGAAYTTVHVNGTFNSWCGDCNPLTDMGNNIWETTLTLPLGNIDYKFTVDGWAGEESFTEGDPCTTTSDGFTNRDLDVTVDETLPTVCWNSCEACGVVPPATSDVTFQVDMADYVSAYDTIYLNGTFNDWCGGCNPMTDDDMDGVWETTLTLEEGNYEYKFTAEGWADQELFTEGDPCTVTNNGFTNRSLVVTDMDETLPVVCWASCEACTGVPTTALVTFQVDMTEFAGTYTTVNLNGTFNGWCGGCTEMTDDNMDNVYEVTVSVPFDTIEYKFTVDGWDGQEEFTEGDVCTSTIDGFTNRSHIVTEDEVLDVNCYASCFACGVVPTVDVTFQVDMSQYAGTFTDVHVNGSFNNFCGTCNPMTDVGGMIYTVTLPIPVGTIEYKFTVDGWTDQEEFMEGDACTSTIDGFTNRTYNVTDAATLGEVCWNSCEACISNTNHVSIYETFTLSPNPASSELVMNIELQNAQDAQIRMINTIGQTVWTESVSNPNSITTLDVSHLAAGIYFISLETNEGTATKKVLVQH